MAVTWTDVVALAPSLVDVPVEAQTLILAQVARQVGPVKWGAWVDDGRLYLAAHLGAMYLSADEAGGGGGSVVGPVQSETVGPVSRTFAILSSSAGSSSAAFDATAWGQEYKRLRSLLVSTVGLVI
jgi:hypothetical protein